MSPLRRACRIAATLAFVALLAGWAVFLRPQYLGGSAGYVMVSGTSMQPRMHTGDIVVVQRRASYRVGDVVAYRIPAGEPASGRVVIHRIRGGSARTGYVMRGDNRASNDLWRPKPKDIVGAAQVHIPGAGRAAAIVLSPLGLGLICGVAVFLLLLPVRLPRPRRNYGALVL
jgi:signal peptidase I